MKKKITHYVLGFMLSLALTVVAFGVIEAHVASGHQFPTHPQAYALLIVLALIQLVVQLTFFLHLHKEDNPRWNLFAFLFAVLIVSIVVGGSLWIMEHLSHMQMTDNEILQSENIFPTHEH